MHANGAMTVSCVVAAVLQVIVVPLLPFRAVLLFVWLVKRRRRTEDETASSLG